LLVLIYPFVFQNFEMWLNARQDFNVQLAQTLYPLTTHFQFAIGFYLVGCWIKKNEKRVKTTFDPLKIRTLLMIVGVSVMMLAYFAVLMTNHTTTLFDPMYNGYATLFTLISSILIFIILKYKIKPVPSSKIISDLSKHSFGIYLLHWPIAYYVKGFLIDESRSISYVSNFILSILILILCLYITKLLKINKITCRLISF